MKKSAILAFALMLALSLAAYAGKDNDTSSGSSGTTPPSSNSATSTPTESSVPGNKSTTAPQGNNKAWPDNNFTKQIPNPAWDSLYRTSEIPNMMFTAKYRTVSKEQATQYSEKLKSAGFDSDIKESDNENDGHTIYKFSAKNKDGFVAGITLIITSGAIGELLLTVQKRNK
jgi:hypothetical protein